MQLEVYTNFHSKSVAASGAYAFALLSHSSHVNVCMNENARQIHLTYMYYIVVHVSSDICVFIILHCIYMYNVGITCIYTVR